MVDLVLVLVRLITSLGSPLVWAAAAAASWVVRGSPEAMVGGDLLEEGRKCQGYAAAAPLPAYLDSWHRL